MSTQASPTYVPVIVHGDVWGAQNANKLVRAVHAHGAIPILIVTRSTPGKDGNPATKLEDLKLPRALKENVMLDYFREVDALTPREGEAEPHMLTLNALARRYCDGGVAHYTTSGGKVGGGQILEVFRALEAAGKAPEVVLSGDTLALLPPEITDNYDCFGTHPGPLPEIKGMQASGRSVINQVFYDVRGARLKDEDLSRSIAMGTTHVKGSFFNLATKLDEGPVIATAVTPAHPAYCLMRVRSDLYYALTEVMVNHLPVLLDRSARRGLMAEKKTAASKAAYHEEIPELDEAALRKWLSDGVGMMGATRRSPLQIVQNAIIDSRELKNAMHSFYPPERNRAFGQAFKRHFAPGLETLNATLKEYMGPDLQIMHYWNDVHQGKRAEPPIHTMGTRADGSPIRMPWFNGPGSPDTPSRKK